MIDVMKYMDDRAFALYDIVALQQRPLDTALAQLDALFVPKNHPLRADGRWSAELRP
jgi:hypothetical protein